MTQLDLFPHVVVYSPNGMVIVRYAKPDEQVCPNCFQLMTPRRRCCSLHCSRCFIELDEAEQPKEHPNEQ